MNFVVIQRARDDAYLGENGSWSVERSKAKRFHTALAASRYWRKNRQSGSVSIIVPHYAIEFRVHLSGTRSHPAPSVFRCGLAGPATN